MKVTFYGDELLMLGYALEFAEKESAKEGKDKIANECAELFKRVDDTVRAEWQRKTKNITG